MAHSVPQKETRFVASLFEVPSKVGQASLGEFLELIVYRCADWFGASTVSLFLRQGDAELMNLKVEETLSQPNEPDREIGADKPGRTHAADGQSASAVEQTDWHEQAEAKFLKLVAAKMEVLVREKNARRIILVAPPKALGTLRANLSADVQAAVSAEVPKDYINLPVDQIERHLAS